MLKNPSLLNPGETVNHRHGYQETSATKLLRTRSNRTETHHLQEPDSLTRHLQVLGSVPGLVRPPAPPEGTRRCLADLADDGELHGLGSETTDDFRTDVTVRLILLTVNR